MYAPGFRDEARQGIHLNKDNRVDFITWTRGNSSSFMLDLNAMEDDAVFELNLGAGHEDIDVSPSLRPPSAIAANRQMVSLFDLVEGPVIRAMNVAGYADFVTFELVSRESDTDIEFSFSDKQGKFGSIKEGDYYYIRVRQLDDEMAWSSPVFVGGFDQS